MAFHPINAWVCMDESVCPRARRTKIRLVGWSTIVGVLCYITNVDGDDDLLGCRGLSTIANQWKTMHRR